MANPYVLGPSEDIIRRAQLLYGYHVGLPLSGDSFDDVKVLACVLTALIEHLDQKEQDKDG